MRMTIKLPELREWQRNKQGCRVAGYVYGHERHKDGKLLLLTYKRLSTFRDHYLIATTLEEEFILMIADYKGEMK